MRFLWVMYVSGRNNKAYLRKITMCLWEIKDRKKMNFRGTFSKNFLTPKTFVFCNIVARFRHKSVSSIDQFLIDNDGQHKQFYRKRWCFGSISQILYRFGCIYLSNNCLFSFECDEPEVLERATQLPIPSCTRLGLSCHQHRCSCGELLPRRFTLTKNLAVCFL